MHTQTPRNTLEYHHRSFAHAFDGLKHTFKSHPNLKIHVALGILALLAGVVFQITRTEWLLVLFTILWVIVSEMINTAIEAVCDLITTEYRTSIKIAKDVAAGMVLVGSFGAVVIGLVIFVPYILQLFK
jgi:diacylglycerol kinase